MIYFIKKYWRYIFVILTVVISVTLGYKNSVFAKNSKSIEKNISVKDNENISKKNENDDILFVDIKGAVISPGVYQMKSNSRIIDVINIAGGLKENANTINLNLSKKIEDESYIIVYTNEEIQSYIKKAGSSDDIKCASKECICPNKSNDACIKKDSLSLESNSNNNSIDAKISINNSTKEELMSLPGIGESKANAIIDYRQKNDGFSSLEDIKNVSGIADSTYEKIKNYIIL